MFRLSRLLPITCSSLRLDFVLLHLATWATHESSNYLQWFMISLLPYQPICGSPQTDFAVHHTISDGSGSTSGYLRKLYQLRWPIIVLSLFQVTCGSFSTRCFDFNRLAFFSAIVSRTLAKADKRSLIFCRGILQATFGGQWRTFLSGRLLVAIPLQLIDFKWLTIAFCSPQQDQSSDFCLPRYLRCLNQHGYVLVVNNQASCTTDHLWWPIIFLLVVHDLVLPSQTH